MKKMMDRNGCKAFSNTFQDLYGMEQLPGLASQHLMAQGYGYGGEGDWKVSAMTAIDEHLIMFVMNPNVGVYGWGLYYWVVKLKEGTDPKVDAITF